MSPGGTGIVPQMYSGITDTQNIKYMVWDMNSTWVTYKNREQVKHKACKKITLFVPQQKSENLTKPGWQGLAGYQTPPKKREKTPALLQSKYSQIFATIFFLLRKTG